MPVQPPDAIVLSQRCLIRDLLAELLRIRCGARAVVRCASFEECLALAQDAKVLICDAHGFAAEALAAFMARLRAGRPALRVVTIDDSPEPCDIDGILKAVQFAPPPAQGPHEDLTPLESEVMLAVATGLRNIDIARRMRRSSKTVEKHRANALRKLGLRNVAQLTAYAIRHRLLDIDVVLGKRES